MPFVNFGGGGHSAGQFVFPKLCVYQAQICANKCKLNSSSLYVCIFVLDV